MGERTELVKLELKWPLVHVSAQLAAAVVLVSLPIMAGVVDPVMGIVFLVLCAPFALALVADTLLKPHVVELDDGGIRERRLIGWSKKLPWSTIRRVHLLGMDRVYLKRGWRSPIMLRRHGMRGDFDGAVRVALHEAGARNIRIDAAGGEQARVAWLERVGLRPALPPARALPRRRD